MSGPFGHFQSNVWSVRSPAAKYPVSSDTDNPMSGQFWHLHPNAWLFRTPAAKCLVSSEADNLPLHASCNCSSTNQAPGGQCHLLRPQMCSLHPPPCRCPDYFTKLAMPGNSNFCFSGQRTCKKELFLTLFIFTNFKVL
jgi:hypothetical protein